MSDLITRWDAAEVVYKALRRPAPDYKKDPFHDSMSLAIAMVRQIPSAQQWIPVTERLPETSDPVLVTYIFHGDRLFTGAKIIREVATANYYNEAWFPHDCEFYYELVDVLAWMPLPESSHPEEVTE